MLTPAEAGYYAFSCDDGIAVLTLNRPEAHNTLDMDALALLRGLVERTGSQPDLRALIITGSGRSFCAGADIKQMVAMDSTAALTFSQAGHAAFDALEVCGLLTVAAINGVALGGGFELALACDYRVAAPIARIGSPEITLGIIPGWGATRRLARLIGQQAARNMILTGKVIEAEEAHALGLIDRVASEREVVEEATDLLAGLLKTSSVIRRYAKRALYAGMALAETEAGRAEQEAFAACFETQDRREGMSAFLERRPPRFTGS